MWSTPCGHRLAQHRDRGGAVLRRPEHAGSGELHGPVAEPLHGAVAELERAGLRDVGHGRISCWRAGCRRRRSARISRDNRHGLCGFSNDDHGSSRTSPPSSPWRGPAAFARAPAPGGASASSLSEAVRRLEARPRRAPPEPDHPQRRAHRGRRAPARAARPGARRGGIRPRRGERLPRPAGRDAAAERAAERGPAGPAGASCRPSWRPIRTSAWRSSSRTASWTSWRRAATPASATTSGWSTT